ncbi:phosphoglycerate dehydrogenase [Weissella paramesenteroides]|uniref:phosphoglycerate dehydrogenase n=1 Tax=Weissella paramesenteroides TaxID=1249 RepID=UPI002073622D|nr:phosphoglycerate dehydrogenase [Weissella paramesenteroides]MCM6765050.1 phosphoglycerate dehydrogenase [Weissella paramesenteroides]MCM6767841.1 phosphoglycerate dehydrogenase [Weissella paramesenteroides]MCM6768884.1 phosphoglycerate dehydrogenase [Weissella paramesenteroides]MCM6770989.1 phosphoglycerate dehydrogenase [Weissella paramesenteroides]MCM6780910.1 phosphoglycerate dehydrogenase [Weissella paramesenteroides]
MADKVIIPKISDELTDHYLSKKGYEVITIDNPGQKDILNLAPDAAVVMMVSKKISNDIYQQMPNLKILARRGVGYDNIDVDFAAKQGVWVTNTPGANAHSVAEMALMNMLQLRRRFRLVDKLTRDDQWVGAYQLLGQDLTAATIGIVGYGHVGQELARLLTALGAKVIIFDRKQKSSPYGKFVSWQKMFETADIISLHLAAVPETRHIVGDREFQWMKPESAIINLARGQIIDEQLLIWALQNKKIAGAALDVFQQEPIDKTNPLLKMDNVIVTPHIGANTQQANQKMAMIAAKMIDTVLRGERPKYAVNNPIL